MRDMLFLFKQGEPSTSPFCRSTTRANPRNYHQAGSRLPHRRRFPESRPSDWVIRTKGASHLPQPEPLLAIPALFAAEERDPAEHRTGLQQKLKGDRLDDGCHRGPRQVRPLWVAHPAPVSPHRPHVERHIDDELADDDSSAGPSTQPPVAIKAISRTNAVRP